MAAWGSNKADHWAEVLAGSESDSVATADAILRRVGATVHDILSQVPRRLRRLETTDRTPLNDIACSVDLAAPLGSVHLAICGGGESVVDATLTAYALAGYMPEWPDVVFCSTTTAWEEIETLLLRWVDSAATQGPVASAAEKEAPGVSGSAGLSALEEKQEPLAPGTMPPRLHCLAGIDKLPLTCQHQTASLLRDLTPKAR